MDAGPIDKTLQSNEYLPMTLPTNVSVDSSHSPYTDGSCIHW